MLLLNKKLDAKMKSMAPSLYFELQKRSMFTSKKENTLVIFWLIVKISWYLQHTHLIHFVISITSDKRVVIVKILINIWHQIIYNYNKIFNFYYKLLIVQNMKFLLNQKKYQLKLLFKFCEIKLNFKVSFLLQLVALWSRYN